VELAVGDEVVYGTHGIGRVVTRKKAVSASGEKHEVVVLELDDGLTVTLPLDRARDQLRPVASEADIRRVQAALRQERVLSADPWLSRRREAMTKLSGGNPVELAEIVGEGAQRERALKADGKRTQLSPGEREIFLKARQLLSDEIARARGLTPEDADSWIDSKLAAQR
jgi:CarD family transcriptional regulator